MTSSSLMPSVLIMAALACATPGQAAAQALEAPADSSKFSANLGLVASSGNTNVLTFTFGETLDLVRGRWTLVQSARMVNGRTDGEQTAQEYGIALQPQYRLARRWRAYVLGSWDRNPFLGIDSRFQEGPGVAWLPLLGPRHFLSIDAGISFFQQNFTDGESSSFPSGRGQVTYKFAFAKKAYLQDIFVFLPRLDDGHSYRINNELALVAPISGRLALKASYLLQYQSAPQPGFGTTDNLFTTGLQITL